MARFLVAGLYKFTPLLADSALQNHIHNACADHDVWGTLLLASEGINGTIAGPEAGIRAVLQLLRALPGCADLSAKESWADEQPFLRMKVRLKKEIVTMGVPGVNPRTAVGHYVEPRDWNALITSPDVMTIDTRNSYEVRIGKFKGAKNPEIRSFRAFPDWFRTFREEHPDVRVAMYCTGGIRCEKSTSLARTEGLEEVYHLKGGILKYLEVIPEPESLWQGECFVFDGRVSVTHGLEQGSYDCCHGCRAPISAADMESEYYEAGITCPHCYDRTTDKQRERFAQRQHQAALAEQRGTRHIGTAPASKK